MYCEQSSTVSCTIMVWWTPASTTRFLPSSVSYCQFPSFLSFPFLLIPRLRPHSHWLPVFFLFSFVSVPRRPFVPASIRIKPLSPPSPSLPPSPLPLKQHTQAGTVSGPVIPQAAAVFPDLFDRLVNVANHAAPRGGMWVSVRPMIGCSFSRCDRVD